ncbi:GyrI-like domain-containing protein [Sporosarcina sp. Te-1]|uniref:GyrI-like domain-containing protein n=1 Tax=Sporosarcina sp. Te-1 TaxID=2818390 RepID=UPI001A9FAA5E|nr:GyrI-like domain-containing protein [Sporosarcina sp. Te-1]QTD39729.1 GyrI-like domain-containing protein [Sporosarcina sp. Te-1]
MEKRIETIEGFTVAGYEIKGSVEEIPALWDKLNGMICEKGLTAEESFGITMAINGTEFHYLAAIKAEVADGVEGLTSLTVPGGRFIVGTVEGGNDMIPAMFDTLMQTPDVEMRYSYGFERYIHPNPEKPYETEVWVPIE